MTGTAPPLGVLMEREMREQPEVAQRLLDAFAGIRAAVHGQRPEPGRGVVLIARGSSDHAAVYARYVLEHTLQVPVALAAPSLATRYRAVPRLEGWTALAISQSGATPEIVDVLAACRRNGARGIAVTNDADSPLAGAADVTVALGAGPELAVPATKTATASFLAVALVAEACAGRSTATSALRAVPDALHRVLESPEGLAAAVESVTRAAGVVSLGRGFVYPAALESALKIKESSGVPAEGASGADFLHGPIAALAGRLVLCHALTGPTAADAAALAARLRDEGVPVVGIGDHVPHLTAHLPVHAEALPEPLRVLPALVRGQQIALGTARALGVDPDAPPALSKITRTS